MFTLLKQSPYSDNPGIHLQLLHSSVELQNLQPHLLLPEHQKPYSPCYRHGDSLTSRNVSKIEESSYRNKTYIASTTAGEIKEIKRKNHHFSPYLMETENWPWTSLSTLSLPQPPSASSMGRPLHDVHYLTQPPPKGLDIRNTPCEASVKTTRNTLCRTSYSKCLINHIYKYHLIDGKRNPLHHEHYLTQPSI